MKKIKLTPEQIEELKEDNPNTKFAQWFLDPLNKKGPDYERNKERIVNLEQLLRSVPIDLGCEVEKSSFPPGFDVVSSSDIKAGLHASLFTIVRRDDNYIEKEANKFNELNGVNTKTSSAPDFAIASNTSASI